MLDAFVPSAPYAEIPELLREHFGALCGSLTFPVPTDPAHDSAAAEAIAQLREGLG